MPETLFQDAAKSLISLRPRSTNLAQIAGFKCQTGFFNNIGTKRTLSEGLLYARKLPLIAHRGPMLLRNEPPPRAALLKAASSHLSNAEAAKAVSSLGVAQGLALPRSRTIEKGQGL